MMEMMGFYSNTIVANIRIQRENGSSISQLSKETGIPYPTISRWVHDIDSDERAFKSVRSSEAVEKERNKGLITNLVIDIEQAKVLSSLLYWCEGSKFPSSNFIAFTNSDKNLMRTFTDLLRMGFPLDESKFRVHLQLHNTHDQMKVFKDWSDYLGIPVSQFYRPTITRPKHLRKRKDYLGTCTVKYFDVKLLLQITGMFEAFAVKVRRGG